MKNKLSQKFFNLRLKNFSKVKIIKEITEELKKIPDVKAAYLFGSTVAGKIKPMSDIDICVITQWNIPEMARSNILAISGKDIDISILRDLPPAIKAKVFAEGKLLFSKDDAFLSDVTVSTIKEYLNFKPVIERFTKIYLSG